MHDGSSGDPQSREKTILLERVRISAEAVKQI
jgi:hypothetical protein